MRKTFGMALIALLVMLALVSCDGILTDQNNDGLVTLSVNTGGIAGSSRSLTDALAHQEANYMEVIFSSGGKYYRAEGYYGVDLKVKVPAGTYDDTNAIILIGKKSEGTLLATGVGPVAGVEVPNPIAGDPNEITFTVTSLTADIYAKTGNAFSIDDTGFPIGFIGNTNAGLFLGEDCFQVPDGITSDIPAMLKIDGFDATGDNILVTSVTGLVTFKPNGNHPAITPTIVAPAAINAAIGTAGEITFTFTTASLPAAVPPDPKRPVDEFRYIIIFDIPVVGFSSTAGIGSAPRTWHIRGGTNPGQPDFNGKGNEGVALRVTDDPDALYGLVVKP